MDNQTVKGLLRRTLRQNKFSSLALLGIVFCVVAASLLPPQILKRLMDSYLTQGRASGLLTMAVLYFASFLLIGLFDFFKGLALSVFGQKLVREIRSAMAEKLTHIQAGYFTATPGGTITSHFLSDVENISSLFSDGLVSMAIDCFKIAGIVLSIWLFSVELGVMTLCLLPLLYGLTAFFRRRMLASQLRNLEEMGRVNNHIAETIKNVLMIQSFHKARYMEQRYEDTLRANYATMSQVNFYDSCYSPIIQMMTALATAAVLLLDSGEQGAFGVSIGTVAATITLITNLFAPVDNLGTELQSIQKGLSGIRSVDVFLAQEEDRRGELPLDLEVLRREGARLCFDHLSFAYPEEEAVLSDISLQLAPRETVCFVGRTGVGKTTLFKLITGLLCPTAGSITLNGVDVYRIPARQKRQIFGYVEQQFHFVQGDISMQISLGNPDISQAQIEAALRFVGLHEMVSALDAGYQTLDGTLFSQGQKQLLSIARAIVTNPPILLLDEITANLDSVTEARVVDVLKRAGREKTILSIAHRTSSMGGNGRIVVLENGRIQEANTPGDISDRTENS